MTLTTDVVALQGPASDTFTWTTTLHNSKEEDVTFTTTAEGPTDWDVTAKATAQSNAVSAIVKAGAVAQITVTADPPEDVVAGDYPVTLTVTAGDETLTAGPVGQDHGQLHADARRRRPRSSRPAGPPAASPTSSSSSPTPAARR